MSGRGPNLHSGMSFGLSRGRELDTAPGVVALSEQELGPLPDSVISDPLAGRIDPRTFFSRPERPFEIEIGSGKGTFLLNHAAEHPDVNFLGIEWAREFFEYAADRIRRRGLVNVRMLRADATEFIRWRVPDGIVRAIHLYYSDPWPKTRHHKNRVVQDAFLAEAHRVLAPGGELRVVTDHEELWDWCQAHFARVTGPAGGSFELREFAPPTWVEGDELVGTNYERKTRAEGRPPRAAVLRKPDPRSRVE